MSLVDTPLAIWLKSEEATAIAEDAPTAALWGAIAIESKGSSCIALEADAQAEAASQRAFLGPPTAVDKVRVPGRHAGLIGKVITLTASAGGFAAGPAVMVIAVDELDDGGTQLTVLRRL